VIVPYHQDERVADDSLPMVTADTVTIEAALPDGTIRQRLEVAPAPANSCFNRARAGFSTASTTLQRVFGFSSARSTPGPVRRFDDRSAGHLPVI
jgi:hypothetical protein